MEGFAIKNLHPLEVRVLRHFAPGDELTAETLSKVLDYKEGHANQAFSWLGSKGLLGELRRSSRTYYEITALGKILAKEGFPPQRILDFLKKAGPKTLPEIASALNLESKDVGSAFGSLSKEGVLALDEQKRVYCLGGGELGGKLKKELDTASSLLQKALACPDGIIGNLSPEETTVIGEYAKKRGAQDAAFRVLERETVVYTLLDAASAVQGELEKAGISGDEFGSLTAKMLASGEWKNGAFRSYNISVPPARLIPGRTNAYVDFLEGVKDQLAAIGFEEFDGPLVETEFWNSDALFMPQFHAARDIHDVYYLKNPTHARSIEEPYLSAVASMHETGADSGSRGWNYAFDRTFTRKLILRSQGTVLSAHQLTKARVPGKYFGVVRCFRYDKVDATHLSDFYQTEGIVLGDEVNLRTLLGFLEMFAREIAGATEVKYVPGYFPFTEPSIEVHIKHPVLGWFELGGSGIFRPEVTRALGVDTPVLAWGIGIDRMALMKLALNDLRELFSGDIEEVRLRR